MWEVLPYLGYALVAFFLFEIFWVIVHARRAVDSGRRAVPVESRGRGGIRILVIGDSQVYGTGASDPANSLIGRLARDYPECTIINVSENAMNLERLVDKLNTMCHERFDVVLLHIGGVDTLRLTRLKRIKALLLEAFTCAKAMGAKNVTLVSVNNVASAKIFHTPLRQLLGYRSKQVSETAAAVCIEATVSHVRLYKSRSVDPLLIGGVHFADDGIHPNDYGYGLWYAEMKQVLAPELERIATKQDSYAV